MCPFIKLTKFSSPIKASVIYIEMKSEALRSFRHFNILASIHQFSTMKHSFNNSFQRKFPYEIRESVILQIDFRIEGTSPYLSIYLNYEIV